MVAVQAMNAKRKQPGVAKNAADKARLLGLPFTVSEETKEKIRKSQLGRKHTEETKAKISAKARASKHRRLRKSQVLYKGVLMDSSWEVALAERLDELGVKWVRPEPLEWVDAEGATRHYFPDFYLPKEGIYLDPKNIHAEAVQRDKLNVILQQYPIVILRTLEACKTYLPPK